MQIGCANCIVEHSEEVHAHRVSGSMKLAQYVIEFHHFFESIHRDFGQTYIFYPRFGGICIEQNTGAFTTVPGTTKARVHRGAADTGLRLQSASALEEVG